MNYASYTRDTSEPIKRLAHARRYDQIVRLIASPADTDIVLDYGCGDAHLFSLFPTHRHLVGYDPNPALIAEASPEISSRCRLTTDLEALRTDFAGRCSLIYCVEVCEHLTDSAMAALFANIKILASPQARIVFGVPIETGLSGFLKGLYRSAKGAATTQEALRALFGLPIERLTTDVEWYGNHTGFSHSAFNEKLKRNGFEIRCARSLPIPLLGELLNNEIYFVCRNVREPSKSC